MVPPKLFEAGDNDLEVLAIEGSGARTTLRSLSVSF